MNIAKNYKGNIYKDKQTAENPGHSLSSALKMLNELDCVIPKDVLEALKEIENPCRSPKGESTYIDLRYEENNKFNGTEYKEWSESFKKCCNWFIKNESLV